MEEMPPGYRFYPTEEELVSFYLQKKLEGRREDLNRVMDEVIPVLYIYDYNPWDLPQFSGAACHGDPEQWFFFIPMQESEARGGRPRRLTTTGYWKATGSPSYVYSSNYNRAIGLKRTMVFYCGRAPHGRKTEWKMNEYKAIDHEAHAGGSHGDLNQPSTAAFSSNPTSTAAAPPLSQEYSLCRVYKKSKILRAFDRRPHGVEIMGNNPAVNINQPPQRHQRGANHNDQPSTSRTTNPILTATERTNIISSGDSTSTSSGDHDPTHQPAAATSQLGEASETLPMAIDNDAIWDLEQLKFWFNYD